MADFVLFCVVLVVPSMLALIAIDSLAGWFPAYRSNDHMMLAFDAQVEMPGESGAHCSGTISRNPRARMASNASDRTVTAGTVSGGRGGGRVLGSPVTGELRSPGGEATV